MKSLLFLAVLVPSLSFAGPAERKTMNEDVVPAINKAQDAYKLKCGCAFKMTVDKSITTKSSLLAAKHLAEEIAQEVLKGCADAEGKAALCKMTALNFEQREKSQVDFKMNGNTGSAGTDGQMRTSWDMVVKVLDK